MTFLRPGVRTKIALLIVHRPGWSGTRPTMCRRIVHAGERRDSLADASAEETEEAAPEDYSAADRGAVVSALVRAEGRSNTEPDRSSDQNVAGAAVMHPWRLIASPGISMPRRKRIPRSALVELGQRFAIVSISRDGGGRCVLTPRRCDCVLHRGIACCLGSACLCKSDRRRQNWRQQEIKVFCVSHKRRVALIARWVGSLGTLSRVSQRFERLADELHIAPQFVNGRLRDQREGNCAATCGQLLRRERITHYRRGLFQSSLPVQLAGIP